MMSSAKSATVKLRDTKQDRHDSVQSHLETKTVCRCKEAGFNEIIPEAVAGSHAITTSGAIEEILPNTSRCPPLNAVDSEEEDEYRANDRECGQALLSTKINDGRSCEDYRHTQSTTFDRSEDQRREPDGTLDQVLGSICDDASYSPERTFDNSKQENECRESIAAYSRDIPYKETINASTDDMHTEVKYIYRSEEDAVQKDDGACGQDITSTGASDECTDDSDTQIKRINISEEDSLQGDNGACGQEPIKLIGAEATEFAVEFLQDISKEFTEIRKQQVDIFRQQLLSEHSRGIFQQKTGAGYDFSSIFNVMSGCRQRFTVQLVRNYCLMKEEMTEAVARRIATACLAPPYVEELNYTRNRKVYVGRLLKLVLRSGTDQIERLFVSTLQREEKKMANTLECTSVSKDDMAEFAKLQIERHDYNFQTEDLPKMFLGKIEVEILNDNLFSSVYFSYTEHTHIENNIGNSVDLLLDTIRKSKDSVLSELELICKNNSIICVSDTETLPGAHLQGMPYVETLENIGIETIDMHAGSIVLTLKLKDENAFAKLKEKCVTGSIGDVLCDISKNERFTQLLKCHSQWVPPDEPHTFKMTLHAIEKEVHFVEMKIKGDLLKEPFCNVKTCETEHPVYICEELEITDVLLATLKDKNLVPRDIEDKLRMLTTRRGKIHSLLSNYNTRKESGFQTLATNIKLVRESRSKEAYPVKIFDGEFVYTICNRNFTRIDHTRCAWLFQQEISADDTVDHIVYAKCDTQYAFKVCDTLANAGRRYATSDIRILSNEWVGKTNDCVLLITSTDEFLLKYYNTDTHQKLRHLIYKTKKILNVLVFHENVSDVKGVVLWMNENMPMPFEIRHVGSNDKLCLQELFGKGSIHKKRFRHDQHMNVNILHTGDTFAHENTVYRELTKGGVGCTLIDNRVSWTYYNLDNGKDDIVLNVLLMGTDAETDFHKSVQRSRQFSGSNCIMIKPINIDLRDDQWLPALKFELIGEMSSSYDVGIAFDRFHTKDPLLQYKRLKSLGLRCILIPESYRSVQRMTHVCRSKTSWPLKVKEIITEHENPKGVEDQTQTIIIRHLKGNFEFENKLYTEVVNHGLGCRIVSEFLDEDFVYPDTMPCVLTQKGVDLNNERLFGHTKKVWQVLLIDMDDKSAEHVHTLMKGLRYKMHDIDVENVRWPQELLKRLTDIQKTEEGTTYEVCISFDIPYAKHANIVYKGLESIGIRCIFAPFESPERGFQRKNGIWLDRVQGKSIVSGLDFHDNVSIERLHVLVIDSAFKEANAPINARSISISVEDTEWPHKVKARLEEFQLFEGPSYQRLTVNPLSDPSRSDISSKIDEEKSSCADSAYGGSPGCYKPRT